MKSRLKHCKFKTKIKIVQKFSLRSLSVEKKKYLNDIIRNVYFLHNAYLISTYKIILHVRVIASHYYVFNQSPMYTNLLK